MIVVVARLKVQDGKAEEFAAAAKEMVASVTTAESGRTLMYALHQAKDDPNTFVFYERYADEDALAAHRTTEHMAAFGGKLRGLLDGRPEVTQLDPVAGV